MSNKALEKIPEVIKILEYLLELSKIRDAKENPIKPEKTSGASAKNLFSFLKDEDIKKSSRN